MSIDSAKSRQFSRIPIPKPSIFLPWNNIDCSEAELLVTRVTTRSNLSVLLDYLISSPTVGQSPSVRDHSRLLIVTFSLKAGIVTLGSRQPAFVSPSNPSNRPHPPSPRPAAPSAPAEKKGSRPKGSKNAPPPPRRDLVLPPIITKPKREVMETKVREQASRPKWKQCEVIPWIQRQWRMLHQGRIVRRAERCAGEGAWSSFVKKKLA